MYYQKECELKGNRDEMREIMEFIITLTKNMCKTNILLKWICDNSIYNKYLIEMDTNLSLKTLTQLI